jgi:hypothetical protein
LGLGFESEAGASFTAFLALAIAFLAAFSTYFTLAFGPSLLPSKLSL